MIKLQAAQANTISTTLGRGEHLREGLDGGSSTIVRSLAVYDSLTQALAWRLPLSCFGGPFDPIPPRGPSLTDMDLIQSSLGAPQLVSNLPVCWWRAKPFPLNVDDSRAGLSVYRPMNG